MNFTLGVGMVLIQQSTNKIVVVHESSKGYWFFPRGRKDLGESLEAAALREAYEEVSVSLTLAVLRKVQVITLPEWLSCRTHASLQPKQSARSTGRTTTVRGTQYGAGLYDHHGCCQYRYDHGVCQYDHLGFRQYGGLPYPEPRQEFGIRISRLMVYWSDPG